ncbi:hypothetical protein NDU88_007303 [Pleurodeles waltl]|uniref:Uncharacterized protein n=1 Tax=Pleurodeles waltl TaxID=8319 RepID=A0AAV7UNH5_PLEWA|nr:hypothetical protein NDU88_007303 [Pleurodeles waltl]
MDRSGAETDADEVRPWMVRLLKNVVPSLLWGLVGRCLWELLVLGGAPLELPPLILTSFWPAHPLRLPGDIRCFFPVLQNAAESMGMVDGAKGAAPQRWHSGGLYERGCSMITEAWCGGLRAAAEVLCTIDASHNYTSDTVGGLPVE